MCANRLQTKIHIMAVHHFGFNDKVYGTIYSPGWIVNHACHTNSIHKLTVQPNGAKCIHMHTSIPLR